MILALGTSQLQEVLGSIPNSGLDSSFALVASFLSPKSGETIFYLLERAAEVTLRYYDAGSALQQTGLQTSPNAKSLFCFHFFSLRCYATHIQYQS